MSQYLTGQIIKGYEILEHIGSGNFGAVYRAYQPTIGRDVAMKVILPTYANRPEFIRLFEAEAQLVARLEHPHIVPLFDYWREPDSAYLVMRLLPHNLRDEIARQGQLAPETTVQIVEQLCSALALFHQQEIVHRDIKPDNILLDAHKNVYLSDFGLAKVIWDNMPHQEDEGVTGSPAYMAPEQFRDEGVSPRTDIYALGLVIYEMLAGSHPFAGHNLPELINWQLSEPLPDITQVINQLPAATNEVIQQATAKDPAARYPDVMQLTAALRGALLGHDPHRTSELFTQTIHKNPYKGLRAFDEADATDFFGRETLVETIIQRLRHPQPLARFLAIVGPSGSGKSSLVRAGVVPALRRGALDGSESWFIATMLPGQHPLQELETSLLRIAAEPVVGLGDRLRADTWGLMAAAETVLGDTPGDIVLVIDQFEEIFTLVQDEQERAHFLNLLHTAVSEPASRVRVLLTLRADFYDRPLLYETFGSLIQARTQVVLPLTTEELERTIVAPAQAAGVEVDPNLVAALVADVREEPGALPLLQYTLTELFERRDGHQMTFESYQDTGGVSGALARRAEEVYSALDDEQKTIVRQLFLRLVTLGEGTEDVRRRATRAELLSIVDDNQALHALLDIFGRHRLLSFDHDPTTREPTVEVAHEALIREWARLRNWLNQSRDDIRQQRRLGELTTEWLTANRDESFLLHGLQLEQFELWAQAASVALTPDEQDFLQQSIAAREAQRAKERRRAEHQQALEARARRFRLGLIVVLSVALVVAVALSAFAFQQRSEAQDARMDAEANAQLSQTQAAAADQAAQIAEQRANTLQSLILTENGEEAIAQNRFDLGAALINIANYLDGPADRAIQALFDHVPHSAVRVYNGHDATVNALAVGPDGQQMVSASDDELLILWDVQTGEVLQTFTSHADQVNTVAFTPDGERLVSGAEDGTVIVWDISSGQPLHRLNHHQIAVLAVAVSPDGRYAATASRDETVVIWDPATGEIVQTLGENGTGHTERVTAVVFTPNRQMVVSGAADNQIIVWDVASGNIQARLEGHVGGITALAVSPDGRHLLSASADGLIIYWELATSSQIFRMSGHNERVTSVRFGPSGQRAVSGGGSPFAGQNSENAVIVWELGRGQVLQRFRGHGLQVTGVAFTPDGRYVLSASADTTLRLWATDTEVRYWQVREPALDFTDFDLDLQAAVALASTRNNSLILWWLDPAADYRPTRTRYFGGGQHTDRINDVAISPNGAQALTGSSDRTLILWDLETGQALVRFSGHTNQVNNVTFNADGTQALSVSRDRTMILWDIQTGEALRVFDPVHTNSITDVTISADSARALTASEDRTIILWDLATGEVIQRLQGHQGSVLNVEFDAGGQQAISSSADQSLIVWNLESGQALQRFEGHSDWVTAGDLSVAGQLVISGARDRTARLWNLATGQTLHTYGGFSGEIVEVKFVQDGAWVVVASAAGEVQLSPASTEAVLTWLEANRYIYELTCEERTHYPVEPCAPSDPGD